MRNPADQVVKPWLETGFAIAFAFIILLISSASANAQYVTHVSLASARNNSAFGSSVTLTATVTFNNSTPGTGTVTFYDGTTILGSKPLSSGQAAISTILLSSGSHSLTAFYAGDTLYPAATSPAVGQTVNAAPATTFASGVTVLPSGPSAVADFDGDGKADIVLSTSSGSAAAILIGNGDGTFAPEKLYTTQLTNQSFVVVGDFNGDGNSDLAFAQNTPYAGLSVLLGHGNGTFSSPVTPSPSVNAWSLAVGDFDGDGKADLVATNNDVHGYIAVMLGNGNGTFGPAVSYAVGSNPYSVAVGDFNGDGKADLVVANLASNTVSVLLGNGDGKFGGAVNFPTGANPSFVALGDFNSDGKADLAVVNSGGSSISILLGDGNGSFSAAVNYTVSSSPFSVAIGDLNGDGKPDLAVVSGFLGGSIAGVNVLLGNGNGMFAQAVTYEPLSTPSSIQIADFNGDGRADLAVFGGNLLLGIGPAATISTTGGTPQSSPILTTFPTPLQVKVTDSSNNPVPGVTLTFAAPPSGASAAVSSTSAVTDNSGAASTPATANSISGSYSVIASTSGVKTPATFVLTNTAGPPAVVTATAGTPQSATINTAFTLPLQVTVRDANNNPLAGVTVTFTPPTSAASAGLSSTTAVTNSAGVAGITAAANSTAGTYTVTASVAGVAATAAFGLTNIAGKPATVIAAAGSTPQSSSINTAFAAPLQVTVTDAGNNPVAGVTVSFAAPTTGASVALSAATAVTNTSGAASVTAKANGIAGSYSVSASITGTSGSVPFVLTNTTGLPATIAATSGTPQTTSIASAFATPLQVIVRDLGGNPVANVSVTFSAPSTGSSADFGNSTTATVQTNSSGVAISPSITANTIAGNYSVTATAAGVTSQAAFALINTPGPPSTIVVTSGSGQSAVALATFLSPLIVIVKDASGNPVPNVTVTFTTPSSGASATFTGAITTAVQTNGSGLASSPTFIANGTAGSYSVTANVAGVATPATFVLTNFPYVATGSSLNLTVSSGNGQSAQVGVAFANAFSVLVTGGGQPIANIGVTFTAPASGPSGTFAGGALTTTAQTNASGIATSTTFTANAVVGSYSIIAAVVSYSSAQFSLTNTPAFSLGGLPATQQPGTAITTATVQLSQPSTVPYSGIVTLSFVPNTSAFDPAVAALLPAGYLGDAGFGTATDTGTIKPSTAALTVPAGSPSVPVPTLDPGTVAGSLKVSFTLPGQTMATTSTITIPTEPPSITGSPTITQASGGFDVDFIVSSTTLDVTTATFVFTASSGYQLQGDTTVTVNINPSVFTAWYANPAAPNYGGNFSLTVPFTLTGDFNAIGSVAVTVSNASGTSHEVGGAKNY